MARIGVSSFCRRVSLAPLSRTALAALAALAASVALSAASAACIDISTGTGGQGAQAAAASDAGVEAGPEGAGCGTDPSTGVTLCTATSECPTLAVDHDAFPHCGFRIRGTATELLCLCEGQLCPVGVYASCEEAAQLLSAQTEANVCVQRLEGRCSAGASGGGGGGGQTPVTGVDPAVKTCNEQCTRECAGIPNCRQLCGC